jgi:hypothetical protein
MKTNNVLKLIQLEQHAQDYGCGRRSQIRMSHLTIQMRLQMLCPFHGSEVGAIDIEVDGDDLRGAVENFFNRNFNQCNREYLPYTCCKEYKTHYGIDSIDAGHWTELQELFEQMFKDMNFDPSNKLELTKIK